MTALLTIPRQPPPLARLAWRAAAAPEPAEWQVLHAIADRLAPPLQEAFLAAVDAFGAAVALRELQPLLEGRQVARVDRALPWDAFAAALAEGTAPVVGEGFAAAAAGAAAFLPQAIRLQLRFDVTNPRAVAWIEQHAAALVREVTAETRAAVRALVARAFREGIPPAPLARLLRERVGLTQQGELAVANYQRFLERLAARSTLANLAPSVQERLLRSGLQQRQLAKLARTGLTPERISHLVDGYRGRLLQERAEAIARTETITASSQGQLELWRQAADAQLLDSKRTRQTWIVTPDSRLCPTVCRPMAGQTVAFGASFRTGDGRRVRTSPAHIRCRCGVRLAFSR